MTTTELKTILEDAHKRDVRLIIIGAILNALGIFLFLCLFIYLGVDFGRIVSNAIGWGDTSSTILNVSVIGIITILVILYSLKDLLVVRNRDKKIEKFIKEIESNAIATNINEFSVPRIVINLIKIKINLGHVNMVTVLLEGNKKPYTLAVPSVLVPELKSILSGADVDKVNKVWNDLYTDEESIDEAEALYELKPAEEFREFVASELTEDIDDIEKQRLARKRTYTIGIVMALVISFGYVMFMFFNSSMLSGSTNSLYIILAIVGGFVYYVYNLFINKGRKSYNATASGDINHEFKKKIFRKMVEFIDPSLSYVMHGHLSLPEFLDTGFFEEKHYDISGNDQILGKYKNVPFQICDLEVTRERNFSKENDEPDKVFTGQVFVAKFNKSFCQEVYIVPRKKGSLLDFSDTSLHMNNLGSKVSLEDPEFMSMFDVYATDQIEARYILSTSLMQRIKDIVKGTKGELYISFRNSRISILNNSWDNRFELSIYKSITKNDQVTMFYNELCQQLRVIDDLKLNEKLWA